MNIREEILKEKVYSKQLATAISEYACSSTENFEELIKCFLDKEYRVAQRAAWSLSWATRKRPELIHPHISKLVEQLGRKDVHNAVIRNSVRILETIDIPEQFHGEVLNRCFEFIESPSTPVAIKAFSLTTLFNLSVLYPDIKPELKLIIETFYDNESAAFKSRAKKILKNCETEINRPILP